MIKIFHSCLYSSNTCTETRLSFWQLHKVPACTTMLHSAPAPPEGFCRCQVLTAEHSPATLHSPGHTVCFWSSSKTSQARFMQGQLDWFLLFHHDLLKQEHGKWEQGKKSQKLDADWCTRCSTRRASLGGKFLWSRTSGREHIHKREILLMELKKPLASIISPRTWGDYSPAWGCLADDQGRKKIEERGKGHMWLPEKVMFELLEWKK